MKSRIPHWTGTRLWLAGLLLFHTLNHAVFLTLDNNLRPGDQFGHMTYAFGLLRSGAMHLDATSKPPLMGVLGAALMGGTNDNQYMMRNCLYGSINML